MMLNKNLLIVDDDHVFTEVLSRALGKRGFQVDFVHDTASVKDHLNSSIDFVILDLMLKGESGLELISYIKAVIPKAYILLLTGYASIATAVAAMKMGADNYLPKPADIDSIINALGDRKSIHNHHAINQPLTLDKLEWEHIQRILLEHDGNISAAARALKMHRRTLQRKLAKPPSPSSIYMTATLSHRKN